MAVATQQTWSLVNEAARRWILNCSEQERASCDREPATRKACEARAKRMSGATDECIAALARARIMRSSRPA